MANGAPTVSNGLVISGVTTSTTFSGSGASLTNLPSAQLTGALPAIDGSNLTNITSTTINNNADNRVITGSGTANTLEGESGLTYSSNTLDVNNAVKLPDDGTVHFGVSDTAYVRGKDSTDGYIKIGTNGTEVARFDTAKTLRMNECPSLDATAGSINITGGGSGGRIAIQGTSSSAGAGLAEMFAFWGTNKVAGMIALSGADTTNKDDGHLTFLTSSAGPSVTERLRIKSDGVVLLPTTGKLSVGTTNPVARFQVGPANGSRQIEIEEYGVIRGYNRNSNAWAQIDFEASSYSFDCGGTERMKINSNGQVTTSNQPSFAAYKSGGGYSLNNEIFPFNSTKHNIGAHYNTSNYRFTAPVAGRYLFTFYSILNSTINSGHYEIRVNNSSGNGQSVHFTTVNSHWDHVSSSHLISLNANDYVTMWSVSNVGWHGGDWALFCGELLS